MEKLVLYGANPIIFLFFYFIHSFVHAEHYYCTVYPFLLLLYLRDRPSNEEQVV